MTFPPRRPGSGVLRALFVGALAASGVLLAPAHAVAQPSGAVRHDQVVLTGRLVVPSDETVDTAVILNGPAIIDGTVKDNVFVLHGRADISGDVGEDVTVLDGTATIRSGAHVGGDVVTSTQPVVEQGATIDGSLRRARTNVDLSDFGFATRFAWWVGYSVSTLVLGFILLWLFRSLDPAAVRVWATGAASAFGLGAAAFFLVPIVSVVLLFTVVGIPLGLFVLLGLALLYTLGYVVASIVVGRLILKPPRSRFLAFLVGWIILRALALIPVVGGLLWLVASILGLGVLFVAARRSRPPAFDAATPPPPPPMPVGA